MSSTLAIAVANHIITLANNENESVSPMKLLKLTYIAHGWSLGLRKKPLFIDEIQAWQYGPVIPSVYEAYKQYRNSSIPAPLIPNGLAVVPKLGHKDSELIKAVWNAYKHLTALALSALTHEAGTPWEQVWNGRSDGRIRPYLRIDEALIKRHYEEIMRNIQMSDIHLAQSS
jgi:uncharacterized phage-associated protein